MILHVYVRDVADAGVHSCRQGSLVSLTLHHTQSLLAHIPFCNDLAKAHRESFSSVTMIISHTSILTAYIEVDFVGIVIGTLVYGYCKSEHKKSIQIYIVPVLDEKLKNSGRAMDDDEIGTSLSGALIECFSQECEECDHRAQNSSCAVSP